MSLLFLLKQKDLDIAVAEAKAAALDWGWWENKTQAIDGTLLLETRKKIEYVALSRFATKVLGSGPAGNLRTMLGAIKWPSGSYKVVLTKQVPCAFTEGELASVIWHSMKTPKVDLEKPDNIFDIVVTSKAAYAGVRAWTNEEDFESRRAHLKPVMHPSSMHPGIARALVNMACADSIHDAFCGTGGMLIEAGTAHKRISGADIDPIMIANCRKNCAAYGLRPELRIADAISWVPRVQAVIGDLPYGRNTRPVALKPLYDAFLLRASQSTSRAVVGLPCELPPPSGWKVRAHVSSYVHKSMTKHFYVLEAT